MRNILILFLCVPLGNIHAQYAMGTTGQLLIPSADMQEDGTFMAGVNYLPTEVTPAVFAYPTMNYFLDMTLFSFVEITYRMTLLKSLNSKGKYTYHEQDRSNTIRLRPIKEKKWWPSVVVGADDLFTQKKTEFWGDYFGTLTKTLRTRSGHRVAFTAGWYFHRGDWAKFNKGPFGGIAYTPAFCPELKLMAEYDTRGWNVGGAIRLWKHLAVHAFTQDFKCVSAGIRYECTLIH
ncbi:MAG: YjbH domain-containing protein [Mediterranea sp.]|nr:YjbH domain-containing protein [Mediterranea sp.]